MLEILLLVFLCKSVGGILREKKRSPILFQVMMVVAWFGGEIAGFIGYGIYMGATGGEFDFTGYIAALGGAVAGAATVFLLAYLVPAAPAEPTFGPSHGQIPPGFPGQPPTSQNPYNPYGDQESPYDWNR
jgi:hypothetical protein